MVGSHLPRSIGLRSKEHWEAIYSQKSAESRSWTQQRPSPSIDWILELVPDRSARIIDVGAGASNLVDHLLEEGYRNPVILDLSMMALKEARERLKGRADSARWIEADITTASFDQSFDLWHDRAVFHFLTSEEDRKRYVETLTKSLKPNGKAVIATFSLEGPLKCSGLEIVRYDELSLSKELGANFRLLRSEKKIHSTPWGAEQSFVYCAFEKKD